MILHLEALTALVVSFATIGGWKIGSTIGRLIADTGIVMPEWTQWLLGPMGTLVALGFALKWMGGRLEKAETKADEREKSIADLTHAQIKVTDKVANAMDALAEELRGRPCGLGIPKTKIERDE